MTYTEAVEKARNNDAAGFEYLYQMTKSNKYYLALKYVKDAEAAKDVLQEAYIRAWKNLDKLKEPEKFDSWLAQIVVNTAKNELEKRNHTPLDLRAESDNEDDNTEIYDRSVSSWDNIPELEYTNEETRQLVHELIDALSDEQRLVVIAFELEGLTTKEIAAQLGCSEATVKSRLRYGRNNIREKAEELQKKGYKLYGVAPVALLLYLLRDDMVVNAAEPTTQFFLAACDGRILREVYDTTPKAVQNVSPAATVQNTQYASPAATVQNTPYTSPAAAVQNTQYAAEKVAFLATKAGKITLGIVLTTAAVSTVAVVSMVAVVSIRNNKAAIEETIEEAIEETIEETVERQEQPVTERRSEKEEIKETEPEENEAKETEPEETETAETEALEQEDITAWHDEVGWSSAYSDILRHIPDHTLYELGEITKFGFQHDIYENLTENGEKFEYALVDLDGNDIPELLIRANTSQTSYDGMSYWIMFTYQRSIIDDNYTSMPIMVQSGVYPVIEGVASIGGSRIFVTMNEAMDEFLLESFSAGNGDTYMYRGYMKYDTGNYFWCKEELGYYTYDQTDAVEEVRKEYPVEIQWKSIDTPVISYFENFKALVEKALSDNEKPEQKPED